LITETENTIIDDILELLNKHGLTSHQTQNLLERLGGIIQMGQRVAKGTTHLRCRTGNTFVNAGNLQSFFPEHRRKSMRRGEKYLKKGQEEYSQNPLLSFCG
jgi:hypothetical protein